MHICTYINNYRFTCPIIRESQKLRLETHLCMIIKRKKYQIIKKGKQIQEDPLLSVGSHYQKKCPITRKMTTFKKVKKKSNQNLSKTKGIKFHD